MMHRYKTGNQFLFNLLSTTSKASTTAPWMRTMNHAASSFHSFAASLNSNDYNDRNHRGGGGGGGFFSGGGYQQNNNNNSRSSSSSSSGSSGGSGGQRQQHQQKQQQHGSNQRHQTSTHNRTQAMADVFGAPKSPHHQPHGSQHKQRSHTGPSQHAQPRPHSPHQPHQQQQKKQAEEGPLTGFKAYQQQVKLETEKKKLDEERQRKELKEQREREKEEKKMQDQQRMNQSRSNNNNNNNKKGSPIREPPQTIAAAIAADETSFDIMSILEANEKQAQKPPRQQVKRAEQPLVEQEVTAAAAAGEARVPTRKHEAELEITDESMRGYGMGDEDDDIDLENEEGDEDESKMSKKERKKLQKATGRSLPDVQSEKYSRVPFVAPHRMRQAEQLNSITKYADVSKLVNTQIPVEINKILCKIQGAEQSESPATKTRNDALHAAADLGLDLILMTRVSDDSAVCRIASYSQYLDHVMSKLEDKLEKSQKNETVKSKVKKVRFKGSTQDQALELKSEQILDFLLEGKHVQVAVLSKEPRVGENMLKKVKGLIEDVVKRETDNNMMLVMDPIHSTSSQSMTIFKTKSKSGK